MLVVKNGRCFAATLDSAAGAQGATDPGIASLDRKGAEAAQLGPVTPRQSGGDLVEDGGDKPLCRNPHVHLGNTVNQVRVSPLRSLHHLDRREPFQDFLPQDRQLHLCRRSDEYRTPKDRC